MAELTVVGLNRPALIDDAYADLARYRWRVDRSGYVFRHADGRVMLHHVVLPISPIAGLVRDHINRDKLDNRLENLRWVTRTENAQNSSASRTNATGIRGVRFDVQAGRYLARIQMGGKAVVRRWFDDPREAGEFLSRERRRLMPVSYEAA